MKCIRGELALFCLLVVATGEAAPVAGNQNQTPALPTYNGWEVEAFGPAEWTETEGRILLQGTTAPGGLFFRRQLDPTQRHRLTIDGQVVTGRTTVRLTVDQGKPEWSAAPDGQKAVIVSGQKLELVIYSDTPFAYRIRDLKIEACSDCPSAGAPIAGAFPGWQAEPFGPLEWTAAADGVRLGGVTGAAGVFLRRSLDRDKSYRLTVAGQSIAGQTTVRLTLDQERPQWLPAPHGQSVFTISGRAALELVVYSDTPFTYSVRSVALDECPTCLTDRQLKDRILAESPKLGEALGGDPLLAARILLNWTANVVDVSNADLGALMTRTAQPMSAAQVLQDVWLTDAGGASCAGFASFFSKVLTLFGYESFTMDFGYEGTPVTHVTTILATRNGAAVDFYVFDPTFNGVYVDGSSGKLVPLGQLLGATSRDAKAHRFETAPIRRDYIYEAAKRTELSTVLAAVDLDWRTCTPPQEGKKAFYVCKGFNYDGRVLRIGWRNDLERLNIPSNADLIRTLMAKRVFSVSTTDDRLRQQFYNLLTAHGIPHTEP